MAFSGKTKCTVRFSAKKYPIKVVIRMEFENLQNINKNQDFSILWGGIPAKVFFRPVATPGTGTGTGTGPAGTQEWDRNRNRNNNMKRSGTGTGTGTGTGQGQGQGQGQDRDRNWRVFQQP